MLENQNVLFISDHSAHRQLQEIEDKPLPDTNLPVRNTGDSRHQTAAQKPNPNLILTLTTVSGCFLSGGGGFVWNQSQERDDYILGWL